MPIYIMAIDPGGTSGLAFRMPNGTLLTCKAQTEEQVYEYFRPDITKPGQVVLELWQYFSGKVTPEGNLTADICAGIRGICYVLGIPLALRTPQSRFPRQNEAEAWYKQTNHLKTIQKIHSHECDALAHLLSWEALHPELQRQLNSGRGTTGTPRGR